MSYDKEFKELIYGHINGFITIDEVGEMDDLLVIKHRCSILIREYFFK